MALNGTLCAQQIVDALASGGKLPGMGASDKDAMKATMAIYLNTLFTHIATNAVVASNVAVVSVAGVTPGSGVSGAGTGTAVGTIS